MTNIEQDILNSEAALIDDHERLREALEAMTRRVAELEKILRNVQCYWNAEDREMGWGDPYEILDHAEPGAVFEIEHVAVVKTTFQALLPASDDSDSDDDFEVCEATRLAAETKISAELERRAALSDTPEVT